MIDWTSLKQQPESGLSASRRISRLLVAAIQSGLLKPGMRLKEAELVTALDVSRTPLREALAGLSAEGIVESDGTGLSVRKLDWHDIKSLYAYRSMLEGMAARLAATHAHDVEGQMIGKLCQEEEAMIARGADAADLAEHNRRFHHAILQAAGNPFLLEGLDRLNRLLVLLGPTAYSIPLRVEAITTEHKAITTAIHAGDGDAAEAAMKAHIDNALKARLEMLNNSDMREID